MHYSAILGLSKSPVATPSQSAKYHADETMDEVMCTWRSCVTSVRFHQHKDPCIHVKINTTLSGPRPIDFPGNEKPTPMSRLT